VVMNKGSVVKNHVVGDNTSLWIKKGRRSRWWQTCGVVKETGGSSEKKARHGVKRAVGVIGCRNR
jgi:hypothetical protein